MHLNRLALLCAAALCGCAHGSTTSTTGTTSSTVTAESSPGTASADQNQPAPGTGHLNITGSITLSKDFNVTECTNNGPNAMAFMRGYEMKGSLPEGLIGASITVQAYDKDGTYHPLLAAEAASTKSINNATQTMSTSGLKIAGNTSLNVSVGTDNQTRPLYAGDKSTLVATLSNGGINGTATFTNWLPLAKTGEARMYGDPVSGTMTWTCKEVEQPS